MTDIAILLIALWLGFGVVILITGLIVKISILRFFGISALIVGAMRLSGADDVSFDIMLFTGLSLIALLVTRDRTQPH